MPLADSIQGVAILQTASMITHEYAYSMGRSWVEGCKRLVGAIETIIK